MRLAPLIQSRCTTPYLHHPSSCIASFIRFLVTLSPAQTVTCGHPFTQCRNRIYITRELIQCDYMYMRVGKGWGSPKPVACAPLAARGVAGEFIFCLCEHDAYFISVKIVSLTKISICSEVSLLLTEMTSLAGLLNQNEQVVYASAVVSGILMCKFVYGVSAWISSNFKCYKKLSEEVKVEWNNRCFSTAHAIFASVAAFYLVWLSNLFHSHSDHELMINRSSIASNSVLSFSIGYFVTDLGMILWHFPALGGKEYILHHSLSMYAIFLSLISGQGQIYILMVLFTEVTTPLVNLRWYLDAAGLKSSTAYVANGIALFLGWLVARVLFFIYFFTHMYFHFDQVKTIFPLGFYSILTLLLHYFLHLGILSLPVNHNHVEGVMETPADCHLVSFLRGRGHGSFLQNPIIKEASRKENRERHVMSSKILPSDSVFEPKIKSDPERVDPVR
ncbi:hypothetical protein H6P81_014755 [Aristolochia fimbriata]|uniref:TLC domain-containing protein n=1 Tax=Aristolochia fimbriata TaxID=158543 RepID=A0AAV7E3A9_ARIFI|nr:hypothetical protein H6P81_014755 [Aristolochia fimbriata]